MPNILAYTQNFQLKALTLGLASNDVLLTKTTKCTLQQSHMRRHTIVFAASRDYNLKLSSDGNYVEVDGNDSPLISLQTGSTSASYANIWNTSRPSLFTHYDWQSARYGHCLGRHALSNSIKTYMFAALTGASTRIHSVVDMDPCNHAGAADLRLPQHGNI